MESRSVRRFVGPDLGLHNLYQKLSPLAGEESQPLKVNTYINFTASDLGLHCLLIKGRQVYLGAIIHSLNIIQ